MTTKNTDTSLTKATVQLREQIREQYPARIRDTWDRDSEALGERDFSSAPAVGAQAPNFRLPDARGGEVELAELRTRGPVVVVFYRGPWCPYCNLQLAAFQGALADITAAGATLVAISPQVPDASLTYAERARLEFNVLSDVGNRVARDYGLVFTQAETSTAVSREIGLELRDYNGDDSHELPAASTFVIAPDGTVQFASISADYRWRIGPKEVLAVLNASAGQREERGSHANI